MLFVLTLSTTYYYKYFLLITRVMYFDPLDKYFLLDYYKFISTFYFGAYFTEQYFTGFYTYFLYYPHNQQSSTLLYACIQYYFLLSDNELLWSTQF